MNNVQLENYNEQQLVTDRLTVYLYVRQLAIYHRLYIIIMCFLILSLYILLRWELTTEGVCLSHLSSTSSLTSRKSKRARIVTSSSHCVTSFELFIVHWNFCNHFRIMEKKKKKKKKREGQALTYTFIYIQYKKKEKICRLFFCIIRVQKAQARFVVNVRYTFSLLAITSSNVVVIV